MEYKRNQIEKEIQQEIDRQNEEIRHNKIAWAKANPYDKQLHGLDYNEVEGYKTNPYKDIDVNTDVNEYSIRHEMNEKYKQDYLTNHWSSKHNSLFDFFSKQIEKLNLEELYSKLIKRHPWIDDEFRAMSQDHPSIIILQNSLAYKFLYPLMLNSLHDLAPSPYNKDQWIWEYVVHLRSSNTQWSSINELLLTQQIQGFPLSDISNFYYTNYPLLMTEETRLDNIVDKNILNYRFNRIDMYRYLARYFSKNTIAIQVDNISITPIAPFLYNELETLSKSELKHLETMLVNIGSEYDPYWICLDKSGAFNHWVAYIPTIEAEHLAKQRLKAFSEKSYKITYQTVDFATNSQQNNLDALSEHDKWHATLLARVVPWCIEKRRKNIDFKSYRHNIPVSLFVEYAFKACLHETSSYRDKLNNAFIKRAPFSNQTFQHLFEAKNKGDTYYLVNDYSIFNNDSILTQFDDQLFKISNDNSQSIPDTLTLNEIANTQTQLIQALYILYHNEHLKCLVIPEIPLSTGFYFKSTNSKLEELFTLNSSLLTVKPTSSLTLDNNSVFPLAMSCAARNRFLKSYVSLDAWNQLNQVKAKSKLWDTTGREVLNFFLTKGAHIDLDFVNKTVQLNKQWKKLYFDHAKEPADQNTLPMWQFAQLAQLGPKGLDVFFEQITKTYINRWEETYKEPVPNLNVAFNLEGSLNDNPTEYTQYLTEKIESLGNKSNGCSPLFKTLSFIMPEDLSTVSSELSKLFEVINNQKNRYPEAVSEINLYNMDITDTNECDRILDSLHKLAQDKNNPLQILVRIPEWDRESLIDDKQRQLKNKYKVIQNLILDHQRHNKFHALTKDTSSIYLCADDKLDPEVIISEKKELKPQAWDGNDVYYPLMAQTPGIQQQLQQAIEQEYEQEQEQEQTHEQEQEQEIMEYKGDERLLITRTNIDTQSASIWQSIPESMKHLSGWKNKELSQLFSLWVGSESDAEHVIKKIEPDAVQKIMKNASAFRLGVSRDNLPAGFYLSYSRVDKGLILCFNERREKEDLLEKTQVKSKKHSAFTVEFNKPMPAEVFRGDLRQFASISKKGESQMLLWKHLATEDNDKQRLSLAFSSSERLLNKKIKPENASVLMQEYTANKGIGKEPEGLKECLKDLNKWAKSTVSNQFNVIDELFDSNSALAFTPNNLKAFGQLFYKHDIINLPSPQKNASHHFIFLAEQIYLTFGKDHFAIWKNRVIDVSDNLSECLAKNEVDAIALSIATLKNKEDRYQTVWWHLVDAHGKSTGHMRYAPLWNSYQKVLQYLEDNNLFFNEESMVTYLKKIDNFQGQVFLDRLYRVLRSSEKELEKQKIQQSILDNIHAIDWRHNGLFYAMRYEGYPYWDDSLQLTEFKEVLNKYKPSYIPELDHFHDLSSEQFVNQCIRFISQRMHLMISEYQDLNTLIKESFVQTDFLNTKNGPLCLRLLITCLSQGVDKFSEYKKEDLIQQINSLKDADPDLLTWLNNVIRLDKDIVNGSMQLRFEHITPFLNAIKNNGLKNQVLQFNELTAKPFINSCGRAIQCYTSEWVKTHWLESSDETSETTLSKLLDFNKKNTRFSNYLLNTAPWLIFDLDNKINDSLEVLGTTYNKQVNVLNKQLQSINFKETKKLPKAKEIVDVTNNILNNYIDPIATRKKFIEKQIETGCAITYQDANFRLLNHNEIAFAKTFMEKHLKPNFKHQTIILCQKFFENCLAIQSEGTTQEKRLERFLKVLARIDNKPYYNDLGQVLGLLLEKAKKSNAQSMRYSVEQLTNWLDSLTNPHTIDNEHYPINMLMEVLAFEEEKNQNGKSTLINTNLDKLTSTISPSQLEQSIADIVRSELPGQYKPVLAKIVLQTQDYNYVKTARNTLQHLHHNAVDTQWLNGIVDLIGLTSSNRISSLYLYKESVLDQISFQLDAQKIDLNTQEQQRILLLWQSTQTKLVEFYTFNRNEIHFNDVMDFRITSIPKDAYIRILILQAMENLDLKKQYADLTELRKNLSKLGTKDLAKLSLYCSSLPVPNLKQLNKLIDSKHYYGVEELIHQFETVDQATLPNGQSKRHYSVTQAEKKSLTRVLNGFKRKGQMALEDQSQKKLLEMTYFLNNYSQVANLSNISFEQLLAELNSNRTELKLASLLKNEKSKEFASMQLLACMREILLRKTGKWANHTQMLDLIYSALHNEESLLHQVSTGQGKSIISLMRVSFLALNGYVVDVFSAKESLSKRDHEEFAHVLDAMGIKNAYITPKSPAEHYQTNDSRDNIGTVNFATIGNFSLFHSTQIWQHTKQINLDPTLRVAILDEGDHILRDENTQFNYSDNNGAEFVYNFDEWVYRNTYEFYLAHKDHFIKDEHGVIKISRNVDLKALCEALQHASVNSPKQSEFFQKYIVPALNLDNKEAITTRDNQLKQLLVAAHVAHGLREGEHFCIRPDQHIVGHGTVINTRFAKVIINNQIKHGSTYSDGVHQLLHIRLNKEAIDKGQAPNFFIEPDSQIAISSNAKYLLKTYYSKIEGYSGSLGNKDDVISYEQNYDIKHVVKLPTHEENRSQFLKHIYCEGIHHQIVTIVDHLIKYNDRPILVTCKDDIEVKKIAGLVRTLLNKNHKEFDSNRLIVDTNDSGKPENEVVPLAGDIGRITFSSRMGRGTDIKPKTDEGLMVLRTYPTIPRVTKQELGRQARNGAKGTVIDIINYNQVEREFQYYLTSAHKDRLLFILTHQEELLKAKLEKYSDTPTGKWQWLQNNTEGQKQYTTARAVEQLKHEVKKNNEMFLRRKEYLIAELSGNVLNTLHEKLHDNEFPHQKIHKDWLICRKKIESIWSVRLAGKSVDSEEVYAEFLKKSSQAWESLCSIYGELNSDLVTGQPSSSSKDIPDFEQDVTQFKAYIIKQIEVLGVQKEYNTPVNEAALVHLKTLKNTIKQIWKLHHPDIQNPNEDQELFKLTTDHLNPLVDELIQRGSQPKTNDNSQHTILIQEEILSDNGMVDDKALILYKHQKKAVSKEYKDHFDSIVTFYQTWVNGADVHYFSSPRLSQENIDEIYGANLKGLTNLYNAIYSISCDQNPKITLLFNTLSALKKPPIYLIPLNTFTEVIQLLATSCHQDDFDHSLTCLTGFFKLKIFKDQDPKTTKPADFQKYGLLFNLITKIAISKYIDSEHPKRSTHHLIGALSNLIREEFWNQFDNKLADDLAKVFASNPDATELLASDNLHSDLHEFVRLINLNKNTNDKNDRLDQLPKYLTTNKELLPETLLGIVRPLFQIVLSGAEVNEKGNFLPKPHCVSLLNSKEQKEFWNFLAQRRPLKEYTVKLLISLLEQGKYNSEYKEKLFKPLINLPPYVSLTYITKQLKGNISKTNLQDCETKLIEIKEASDAFNQFAYGHQLVSSDIRYSHKPEGEKKLYHRFNEVFHAMSADQAKQFFELSANDTFSTVTLETKLTMAQAWQSNTIQEIKQISKLLGVAKKIQTLPKSCAESITDELHQSLALVEKNKLDNAFNKVSTFMKVVDNQLIYESTLNSIWNAWEQEKIADERQLQEHINAVGHVQKASSLSDDDVASLYQDLKQDQLNHDDVLKSIEVLKTAARFQTKYPTIPIIKQFKSESKKHKDIVKYSDFLSAVKSTSFSDETMNALYRAYFVDKKIITKDALTETIQVINEAKKLQKTNNWVDYFGDLFCSKHKERKSIMHLLFNNILNLGKSFAEQCYKEYLKLANWIIQVPDLKGLSAEKRRYALGENHRKIVHFGQELSDIGGENNLTTHSNAHRYTQLKHNAFFNQKHNEYHAEWWKNSTRKTQAHQLFTNLGEVFISDTPENEYYENTLKRIWESQKEILESDLNTNRNTKGYSRLYDITVQMTLQVVKDYIENTNISVQDKGWINTHLREQMDYQIKLLSERLPINQYNDLKELLSQFSSNEMKPGTTDLKLFEDKLRQVNWDNVPSNLQYLVTNINLFIDLSNSANNSIDLMKNF